MTAYHLKSTFITELYHHKESCGWPQNHIEVVIEFIMHRILPLLSISPVCSRRQNIIHDNILEEMFSKIDHAVLSLPNLILVIIFDGGYEKANIFIKTVKGIFRQGAL